MLPRRICLIAMTSLMTLGAVNASDDIPWKSELYVHIANEQPLPALLREFGADQGVNVVVSENVVGTISGDFRLPPQQFLSEISRDNALNWYFDGAALYIYSNDQLESQLIQLQFSEPGAFLDTLDRLGIITRRFPLRVLEDANAIYVIGPPRYLQAINEVLGTLDAAAQAREDAELDVKIFSLKYAWADDQTFFFQNTEVIVPGVATTLRNLLSGEGGAAGSTSRVVPLPNVVPGLRGSGLIGQRRRDAFRGFLQGTDLTRGGVGNLEQLPPPAAEGEAVDPGVFIQADPRTNSVIIQDRKDRLDSYDELIELLDQPVGLVEISAALIDVQTNCGFDYGPPFQQEWPYNGTQIQANFVLDPIDTANITATILRDGSTRFLTNIQALETEGLAKLVSRPSVLTVDNTRASFAADFTFFVRIAGDFQTDLFNVSFGTNLDIVPHIINDDDGRKIRLTISVSDGNATGETVDEIPIIFNQNITTQAILREHESLLIGGLIREEHDIERKLVPILGRIPFIGPVLFTRHNTMRQEIERLVLITPRIVELSYTQHLAPPVEEWPLPTHRFMTPPVDFMPVEPTEKPYCVVCEDHHHHHHKHWLRNPTGSRQVVTPAFALMPHVADPTEMEMMQPGGVLQLQQPLGEPEWQEPQYDQPQVEVVPPGRASEGPSREEVGPLPVPSENGRTNSAPSSQSSLPAIAPPVVRPSPRIWLQSNDGEGNGESRGGVSMPDRGVSQAAWSSRLRPQQDVRRASYRSSAFGERSPNGPIQVRPVEVIRTNSYESKATPVYSRQPVVRRSRSHTNRPGAVEPGRSSVSTGNALRVLDSPRD